MQDADVVGSFKEAVALLKSDYPQKAAVLLKRCVDADRANPYYSSFLGLAIARSKKSSLEAAKLCESALQSGKRELQFHLNLAEVYVATGQRDSAIATLDRARESFGPSSRLAKARARAEKRSAPVLPFLDRSNPLNKNLGKLRHRVTRRFSAI
jgi:predicted Zn-dependent protease